MTVPDEIQALKDAQLVSKAKSLAGSNGWRTDDAFLDRPEPAVREFLTRGRVTADAVEVAA